MPEADVGSPSPQPDLSSLDALAGAMATSGMEVAVEKLGHPRALSPAIELNAYRIVQEALTNALKHGNATRADVTLCFEPSLLTIDVIDNGTAGGRGLPRSGHGLIGVRERAHIFGGHVDVGPGSEGGWHLRAALPLSRSSLEESHVLPNGCGR